MTTELSITNPDLAHDFCEKAVILLAVTVAMLSTD